ncbi:ABC transporter permease subunit [uncultured Ferrimonas sp.]|uniref:ABC transporter permease subunit n=1 Tax=uncultured Ferrimonas sp. TaxID=432640 RepID=UPI00262872B0|nr:ABC transporter permease subunit [uncultured Ferrimonas sp.]
MESKAADLLLSSRRRLLKDKLARLGIIGGGSLVLIALLLIFFYLLYVVAPTFLSASISPRFSSAKLSPGQTALLGIEESRQYGYRLTTDGTAEFYHVSGAHQSRQLSLQNGVEISAIASAHAAAETVAYGLSNGQVIIAKPSFEISYPNDIRSSTPILTYPLGPQQLQLDKQGRRIANLAFAASDEQLSLLWQGGDQAWHLTRFHASVDFISDKHQWQRSDVELPQLPVQVDKLLLTPDQQQLFVLADNQVQIWRLTDANGLTQPQRLEHGGGLISDIALLAGASSLLVATEAGTVSQWFETRGDDGRQYRRIRQFDNGQAARTLASEYFRRTFAVGDDNGGITLWHATSGQELLSQSLEQPVQAMAFAPAGNGLIVELGDRISMMTLRNEHPEVSWRALWQPLWYEGYPEPDYLWQSTSGSDDFEAKLSVMPLVFGTMKAALYAMLFAVPIAISGAIYTAYFMTAKVRALVKPTIEIMEALPTVILGFLAGLWLAPIVEANLPGVLLLLLMLPLTILLVAWGWQKLPASIQERPLLQYRELLLLPLLILVCWGCFAFSPLAEQWFMGGDGRAFVTNTLNIPFDQRNALVVGLAMGFAVIPTIFSIAEDAIFSVPRHLVNGSLALGATQWQTLTRVVLLTASPGIFSAVMMGFGRAVGETMIVLMATGNTALMKWNPFEGMRTLAANIAIEMPESAIGSSHYRVLFLTALVLFVFTFIFNTVAELVRQHLRQKYSSL